MNDLKIDKLIRSKRQTLSLTVDSQARIIIHAPVRIKEKQILDFIARKKDWIIEKQAIARERLLHKNSKKFEDGEKFIYLGNYYPLMIVDNYKYSFNFNKENFILDSKYRHVARKVFILWYKQQAERFIKSRVVYFSNITGIACNNTGITNAKKRWGSCGTNRNLNFAWRLVLAPASVVDYVVVHELAHILEMNHSQKFWRKVASILPGYKKERLWLKENGHILDI